MSLYNYFVIVFLIYYTFYFVRLFTKTTRNNIQIVNKNINKLRKIKLKSIEEQKQFIDLKYPKHNKFIFTWKWLLKVLLTIILSICLFFIYKKIFTILKINLPLWIAVLFIIVFPILINLILKKFNLEQDDITIFFR